MNKDQETMLGFAGSFIRFATYHPYAATGIVGAAVGSAVTYGVMTSDRFKAATNGVFTPKVYELELSHEDLRRMLADPLMEIRMETAEMTLVVTAEKREPLKALPDIVIE
jgi:hypothetical protein